MKNIYFAGPDVFSPKYNELVESIRDSCYKHNFNPLFPTDLVIKDEKDNVSIPTQIFRSNKAMIERSDYVIANMNEFRGCEPDSGTVWEVAYAYARNIPAVGYMSDTRCMQDKVAEHFCIQDCDSMSVMPDKMRIENFDFPINLMLHESMVNILRGDYLDALNYVFALDKKHIYGQ